MEGDNPHTAMVPSLIISSLIFYCEETGEYRVQNVAWVELHTHLWVVNCAGNPEGEKESLKHLIAGMVMEFDLMFVVQVLNNEEKKKWIHPHRGFVAWHR